MHYAYCYRTLLTLSDFIQTVLPVYLEKHLFVSN